MNACYSEGGRKCNSAGIRSVCNVDLLGIRYEQQIPEQEVLPLPSPAFPEHHGAVEHQDVTGWYRAVGAAVQAAAVTLGCCGALASGVQATAVTLGCCWALAADVRLQGRASPATQPMPQNSQSQVKYIPGFCAKGEGWPQTKNESQYPAQSSRAQMREPPSYRQLLRGRRPLFAGHVLGLPATRVWKGGSSTVGQIRAVGRGEAKGRVLQEGKNQSKTGQLVASCTLNKMTGRFVKER